MVYISLHDISELEIKDYTKVREDYLGEYFVLTVRGKNKKGEEFEITFFSEHNLDWRTGEEIEICELKELEDYPELKVRDKNE